MTEETKSEIKKAGKSFKCAMRGLKYAIFSERNFQIEMIIALMVVALILVFRIKSWEAVILILMIMWVLMVELTNTIVERVIDILKPRSHPYIGLIKDMMAAVVLFSAIFAIAIGLIIFYPYLKILFYY